MPRVGPIEYLVDGARRFVTFISHEDPSLEEWIAALEAIFADPDFQPGFGFLSDRRTVREPAASNFVQEAARYLSKRRDIFAGGRWAVLVDTPVGYGMARLGQAYISEGLCLQVEIFKDRDEAVAWLCERDRRAGAGANPVVGD